MSKELEFQFEHQEKYVGNVEEIKSSITHCKHCGFEMIFTHQPDYRNLILQEVARCTKCKKGSRKLIHIMN